VEPDQISVTVESGIDWIGSVLIPVAAILVSSGIALYLASRERRASDRSHLRAEAARLVENLTELQRTAATGDRQGARTASVAFSGTLNTFTAYLQRSDVAVGQFLTIVISRAIATGDLPTVGRAALFLNSAVDAWLRGEIRTKDFSDNMPADTEDAWVSGVDLAAWPSVIAGTDSRSKT
jgi:hypothetical protein